MKDGQEIKNIATAVVEIELKRLLKIEALSSDSLQALDISTVDLIMLSDRIEERLRFKLDEPMLKIFLSAKHVSVLVEVITAELGLMLDEHLREERSNWLQVMETL